MTKNFAGNHATTAIDGVEGGFIGSLPGGSDIPDPLLTDVEMAATFGCARSTLWRWVSNGTIEPPLKIGGLSRWRSSYAAARIAQAEAEREAG
jgi:predicted DNA-binding transcriptional regulator AlpA